MGIWFCLLVSIAILGLGPGHQQTYLANAIQSAGHFAFFGAFGLLTAIAAPIMVPQLRRRRWLQYGLGLGASVLGGGMLEVVQYLLPGRTPSWDDLTRDALGGVAAVSLLLIVESPSSQRAWSRIARRLAWPAFIMSVTIALAPAIQCGWDYWQRAQSVPRLLPIESAWTQRFLWQDPLVSSQRMPRSAEWPRDDTPYVLRLEFPNSTKYPGFGMKEPYPDWRDYEWFVFEVWNYEPQEVDVWLRIHDFQHNDDYHDRYHCRLQLAPGGQTCKVSLREVERSLRHRKLDLSSIAGFKLMAIRPSSPIHLAVAGFRLE